MANREEKGKDYYAVLGLKKECSDLELRTAYKKLALRWHPDRCSASGNPKFMEEAKKKFQDIQQAYSVLSDSSKRFLYDVGAYESDDDDEDGMGDFLNEMAVMMSQTKPNENGGESFEQLQELFEEMFQSDINSFSSFSQPIGSCSTSSSYTSYCEISTPNNKRSSSDMNHSNGTLDSFEAHFPSFCIGAGTRQGIGKGIRARENIRGATGRQRERRKQKVASGQDVSANGHSGISAR